MARSFRFPLPETPPHIPTHDNKKQTSPSTTQSHNATQKASVFIHRPKILSPPLIVGRKIQDFSSRTRHFQAQNPTISIATGNLLTENIGSHPDKLRSCSDNLGVFFRTIPTPFRKNPTQKPSSPFFYRQKSAYIHRKPPFFDILTPPFCPNFRPHDFLSLFQPHTKPLFPISIGKDRIKKRIFPKKLSPLPKSQQTKTQHDDTTTHILG